MRKIDKKLNLAKANLLTEQRYLASKGFESENLDEEYYDELKPNEGYVDAEEILGKRVWIHTNFTNRNQGRNGLVGLYSTDGKGYKTGSPIGYTNEIRIGGGLVFEQSEKGAAWIEKNQIKQLVAGVSGIVIPTNSGDVSGMELVTYDAKSGLGYFHLVGNHTEKPKKIIGGDEVYLICSRELKFSFYVKNPMFEEEVSQELEMEPELAEDIEKNRIPFEPSPMLNDLVIVKTQTEYILVNKMDNKIEAELGPINAYKSKEQLCTVALRLHSEIFESYKDVYHGGGEILGPLSACRKGGLEEEVLDEERTPNQDIYFETLSEALDAVRAKANAYGLEVDEEDIWTYFGTGGIGYGETEQANLRLLQHGKPMSGNRFIHVSIYRMPSGRYELTAYKTW